MLLERSACGRGQIVTDIPSIPPMRGENLHREPLAKKPSILKMIPRYGRERIG